MHHVRVPAPVVVRNPDNDQPYVRVLTVKEREEYLAADPKPKHVIIEYDAQKQPVYFVADEPWTIYRFMTKFVFHDIKLGGSEDDKKRAIKAAKFIRRLTRHFKPIEWTGDENDETTWPVVSLDSDCIEAVSRVLDSLDSEVGSMLGLLSQTLQFVDAFKNAMDEDAWAKANKKTVMA